VNGLLSGFTGDGAKTVIPATAMAKVSMRLVPDQLPDKVAEQFEAYLKKVAPRTVSVTLTRMHGGRPWMTGFDNPFVQAAGRAIEQGFGKAPVFNREGGSIPVVSTFEEALGVPSVLFGVGCPTKTPRAEREARSGQLPRRDHRLGVPLRRGRQAAVRDPVPALAAFYGPLAQPPADPFGAYVWEVLGMKTTPARRDSALSALRRVPAMTPDSMRKLGRGKLEGIVRLCGPFVDERLSALETGIDVFRRRRNLQEQLQGPLRGAWLAVQDLPHVGGRRRRGAFCSSRRLTSSCPSRQR
jgi:hypothetical protein